MITALRKSFKSNFNKVILWLTVLAVAGIFSIPELFKKSSNSPWVSLVNGDEISYNDFARKTAMTNERMNMLRAQYGEYADYFFKVLGLSSDPKVVAMEQLVQETLFNQATRQLGMRISDEYIGEKLSNPLFVQQELADIIPMGLFDSSGLNPQALHKYLHHIRLSGVEFEESIAQALMRKTLREVVANAGYVPEIELKQQFIAKYVDKNYAVLILPLKNFVREQQKNAISEQDLKHYFDAKNATAKKYWVPEKRSGSVWHFTPERYDVTVTDEAVANFYEDHKVSKYADEPAKIQIRYILFQVSNEQTRSATLDKAQQTRAQLLANKDNFAAVAKETSSDRDSAAKGGLLPAFARGQQEPAIDKAAFLLKQDGDISELIPTTKGYALIQRVSKTAPTFKSLANVKKDIVAILTQQKFNEFFARDMQSIIDQGQGDAAKLTSLLKAKGGKEEMLTAVVRNDGKWADALFGITVPGKASFMMDNGTGIVVQLKEINERYLPGLESIKDMVTNDMHEERASKQLHKAAQEALAKSRNTNLKDMNAEFNGTLEKIDRLSQQDTSKIEALNKRGFPVDQILQLVNIGSSVEFQVESDRYIVQLEHLANYTPEQYKEKRAELKTELDQMAKRLVLEGFVASLIRSAKIETNESLITLNEE